MNHLVGLILVDIRCRKAIITSDLLLPTLELANLLGRSGDSCGLEGPKQMQDEFCPAALGKSLASSNSNRRRFRKTCPTLYAGTAAGPRNALPASLSTRISEYSGPRNSVPAFK